MLPMTAWGVRVSAWGPQDPAAWHGCLCPRPELCHRNVTRLPELPRSSSLTGWAVYPPPAAAGTAHTMIMCIVFHIYIYIHVCATYE